MTFSQPAAIFPAELKQTHTTLADTESRMSMPFIDIDNIYIICGRHFTLLPSSFDWCPGLVSAFLKVAIASAYALIYTGID
jgi:hypothetical protein